MSLLDPNAVSAVDNTIAANGGNAGQFQTLYYADPQNALLLLGRFEFLLSVLKEEAFRDYYKSCFVDLTARVATYSTLNALQGFDQAQISGTSSFTYVPPGDTPGPTGPPPPLTTANDLTVTQSSPAVTDYALRVLDLDDNAVFRVDPAEQIATIGINHLDKPIMTIGDYDFGAGTMPTALVQCDQFAVVDDYPSFTSAFAFFPTQGALTLFHAGLDITSESTNALDVKNENGDSILLIDNSGGGQGTVQIAGSSSENKFVVQETGVLPALRVDTTHNIVTAANLVVTGTFESPASVYTLIATKDLSALNTVDFDIDPFSSTAVFQLEFLNVLGNAGFAGNTISLSMFSPFSVPATAVYTSQIWTSAVTSSRASATVVPICSGSDAGTGVGGTVRFQTGGYGSGQWVIFQSSLVYLMSFDAVSEMTQGTFQGMSGSGSLNGSTLRISSNNVWTSGQINLWRLGS